MKTRFRVFFIFTGVILGLAPMQTHAVYGQPLRIAYTSMIYEVYAAKYFKRVPEATGGNPNNFTRDLPYPRFAPGSHAATLCRAQIRSRPSLHRVRGLYKSR